MSLKSYRFNALMLTTALVGLGVATSAYAQTQPAAADDGIEDIVVTARKNAEASQTVPVAITALSQAAIERKIVLSAQDLQLSVPGLFVAPNSQGGAPTFAIRAAKEDNGTSSAVTTYINDMPTSSTLAIARMIYDMQSVTTLKGPQGTLFGANSTGGAIIFRPNTPTDKLEGYIEGGLGNFNRKTMQGVINLPVNDIFAMRIAGDFVRRDGFVKNNATAAQRGRSSEEFSDNRYESGRFSAKFTPSDAIQNDLMVSYFHENDKPVQAIPVFLRPRFNYPTFLGFSVPVDYAKAGIVASPNERNVVQGSDPTYNRASIWAVTNATTVDLSSDLTAKLALGYERDRLDTFESNSGTVGTVVNGRSQNHLRQYTVEPSLDYVGADGALRIKLGGFYSDLKRNTGNSYGVIGLPFDLTGFPPAAAGAVAAFLPLLNASYYTRNTTAKAVFSQWAYDLSDTLTATVGARYTWNKGKYSARNFNQFGGTLTTANIGNFSAPIASCAAGLATYKNFNAATCTGYQDYKTSSPSFTATLENKFSATTMAYATVRTGYLVGGFNNQVFVPGGFAQVFKPEKVMDAEIGLKSDWRLGGRPIRTNVDIFAGRYKDQQRVQNGTTPTGTTFIAVQNAGKSHFYGADLEVIYSPADILDLSANYQYVHAEYDEFRAPLNIPGVTGAYVDFKGEKLSQTPEHIVNLAATFKAPIDDSYGKLSATVSYFWRSKTTGHDAPTVSGTVAPASAPNAGELLTITDDFSQYDKLPSFGLVNLSINWEKVMDSNFDLKFWVKNLTDKTYAVYQSNQLLQYGYATYTYGNPREIGVNVRYAF